MFRLMEEVMVYQLSSGVQREVETVEIDVTSREVFDSDFN